MRHVDVVGSDIGGIGFSALFACSASAFLGVGGGSHDDRVKTLL